MVLEEGGHGERWERREEEGGGWKRREYSKSLILRCQRFVRWVTGSTCRIT